MSKHAFLSPSAAKRWMSCPAAPTREAALPDESTTYAEEGTLAHAICETKLREDEDELDRLRTDPRHTEEMEECSDSYVAYVRALLLAERQKTKDARMLVETRLDLREYAAECFGTADCVIIGDDTLHVVDFKYGKGVAVDAFRNPQIMIYALGALSELDYMFSPRLVAMHIFQPRLCSLTDYEMNAEDLKTWGREVLHPAALNTLNHPNVAHAGSWCRFCKARHGCRELALYCDVPCTPPGQLSVKEIAELLERVPVIKSWATDLEGHALRLALDGQRVPGYKVVEGRSRRYVTDVEGLGQVLEGQGYTDEQVFAPRALRSLSELEKLVGKTRFAALSKDYVDKPAGAPTLVPESDKRPALELNTAANDFKDINISNDD